MGHNDWGSGLENTREGNLYRENKRLQQEAEDIRYRRLREDTEREINEYRAEQRRRLECESRTENLMNMSDMIQDRDEDIKHLRLCLKFGIEEIDE